MIWVWLAIVASFAWHFYVAYGNENELLKLLRAHGALSNQMRSLYEEMQSEIFKLRDETEVIRKRLGYEELDRSLGQDIIWGENRERALKSIFPRIANLEFRVEFLAYEAHALQTEAAK